MNDDMLPEIRPYLEHLFDEICLHAGMRVDNPQTREKLLNYLHDQLRTFAYARLQTALPPSARQRFTFLFEQQVSMETLLTLTRKYLPNVADLLPPIFVAFRAHYLRSEANHH